MTTFWKPERTGRWIFHCHILTHTSPETSALHHEDMHDGGPHTDPLNHMTGLVMGIAILPHNGTYPASELPKAERKLQLLIEKDKSNPKKYTYSIFEPGKVPQTGGGPRPNPGAHS